jgi:5-methylcytosine-specific restriction endonuclease McrA
MSEKKKQIRNDFCTIVFERDGHACVFCGSKESLDAHHITDRKEMPNGGYVKENGITVCGSCHMKCEMFHMTEGEDWFPGRHPADLYTIIGSSYEEAVAASERLK